MGRISAGNKSKAATRGKTKSVNANASNPRKNLMNAWPPCQQKNEHCNEDEEYESSVDSDGETEDVAEFENEKNLNRNHQVGVRKQLLANEEWETAQENQK